MNFRLFVVVLAIAAGCSDEKEAAAPVVAPPSVAVNAAPVPSSVSVAPPAPTSPPPALPASGASSATSTSSKASLNGQVYTTDDSGQVLQGEALLKKAIMQHVEGLGNPYPVRIEELVEKGTLKSLPPAPNGQHWAIDPKSKQVILQ